MALAKNVTAFINHVKGHCKEVGIKCDIRPVKYLRLSGNIRCSGYFCEETMKLVVAGKSKDWLGILVHEYAHLTQWQDKSTNIWKTGSIGVTHLDDWLGGKKIRSIKKAIEWSRDLELDNEKRSVKLIKKWKLPIDLNDYIKKANAYVQFYNYMTINKPILRETLIMVLTGLIINYPVGIFLTWLFLDVFKWTSSFLLATANTIAFSVIAVIRVYYLRVKWFNEQPK